MKIYAAIIGTGIGIKHFEAINNYKNSKVICIYEKDRKKRKILKKKYKNIDIISNENKIYKNKLINLVSIASYDNFHYNQIIKCIKYKKNFIVEKPMCLTLSQLTKIRELLKKNPNIKMISNLVLRCNRFFNEVKKTINKKKVIAIEADYIWGRRHKLQEWRSQIKNYSIILGAGIHVIDLVMWLLKSKPISVYSFGNKNGTSKGKFLKYSYVNSIFTFPNNILVKIGVNASGIYNHFHELRVFLQNQTIVHGLGGSFSFTEKKKKKIFKIIKPKYPDKDNRKKLIRNFINDIKLNKNSNSMITKREQFNLMSVCFAAEESLKKNKKIKIVY